VQIEQNRGQEYTMPVFYDLALRKVIGCGKSRSVWMSANGTAAKVSHRFHNGATNRMEWAIWHNAPTSLKKMLVKPLSIHQNGVYMVVEMGQPIKKHEIPANVPPYITDTKYQNWVKINGVVLLADYGQGGIVKHLKLDREKLLDENFPVEHLC
jgi:hypothetical protein